MAPLPATVITWVLAAVTVAASIAVAFAIAREVDRRERRRRRDEVAALAGAFFAFVDGGLAAADVRRAAREAAEPTFWLALEATARRIHRRGRALLSTALERNRHSARERRLLRTEPPERRELAAARLGMLRSRRSRAALRAAMKRGPESVTAAALRALARDRDLAALDWALDHPELLRRRPATVWVSLLRAFGTRAVPALAARLDAGIDHAPLRRAVLEILGIVRHLPAAAAIERHLGDGTLDVRVAAARALGRLRVAARAPSLIAALRDEAWQVRALSAWALGETHAHTATVPLVECVTDSSWWVRRHAAYALAALGERAALAAIVRDSPDRYAREIAQEALDRCGLRHTG